MGSSAEWECSAEHSWWNSDLETKAHSYICEMDFLELQN